MKLFRCDHCSHVLYFENAACGNCGHRVGYIPEINDVVSLDPDGTLWTTPRVANTTYVFCQNAAQGACNWLIESESGGEIYCVACRHNEVVPLYSDPIQLSRWQTIERAKHRLFYSLLRLNLPLQNRVEDPVHGLSFRFLADGPANAPAPDPVLTGHEDGVITIALVEADDSEREKRRTQMHEPYRTLLGHFRHEIGHHYWDLLVDGSARLDEFRRIFGDESPDYGEALQRHYARGAPPDWQRNFISAYATSHPWEDFAETWAHYLHIVDTIETAAAFGVRVRPGVDGDGSLTARMTLDPYEAGDIQMVVDDWVPLALLVNNLNRSIGHADAYPFVLTRPIVEKLGFIQRLVHGAH